jgi:hypothetical protein
MPLIYRCRSRAVGVTAPTKSGFSLTQWHHVAFSIEESSQLGRRFRPIYFPITIVEQQSWQTVAKTYGNWRRSPFYVPKGDKVFVRWSITAERTKSRPIMEIDTLCTCRFNFQFSIFNFFFSQRPKHLIITSQLQAPRANFSTEYVIHSLAKAWLFWVVCSSTTESVSKVRTEGARSNHRALASDEQKKGPQVLWLQ